MSYNRLQLHQHPHALDPATQQSRSPYTGKDIIMKLVSTLYFKKSTKKAFRLLIVATHRDCVEQSQRQTKVEALNRDLQSLLLPEYQNVLPNHVFVDPQVPIELVNELVRFSYKSFEFVSAKQVNLLERGIITEDLLKCAEISSHFKKDIYEVKNAIKLFCHTFTLAPLETDTKWVREVPTPVTWENLIGTLREIELNALAAYVQKTHTSSKIFDT